MDKIILISCMLVIGTILTTAQPNDLGGRLRFSCAPFRSPSIISSAFHPSFGDRRWFVQCAPIPGIWDVCYDTRILRARIPRTGHFCDGGILAGARSWFNPFYRDREWSFQCCFSSQFVTTRCRSTFPFLYQQNFNFQVQGVLGGMTGIDYSTFAWDRRWSLTVCDIAFRGPGRRLSLRKGRGGKLKFPLRKGHGGRSKILSRKVHGGRSNVLLRKGSKVIPVPVRKGHGGRSKILSRKVHGGRSNVLLRKGSKVIPVPTPGGDKPKNPESKPTISKGGPEISRSPRDDNRRRNG